MKRLYRLLDKDKKDRGYRDIVCLERNYMESRSKYAKKNITVGLIYKILAILLPFINRTIILYTLGVVYTGLGSLFSSVLQVLNLAELGFGSAVAFCMYKPIADNDNDTVNALLAFYQKVYRIIGAIVLAIGVLLMPFLPYLIKGETPAGLNVYILFSIYLLDSVISYVLFAYKTTLLTANQRNDVVNGILSISTLIKYLAQFVVLLVTHNYYLYVSMLPVFTIFNNFVTDYYSRKLFPQYKCKGTINKNTKLILNKKIRGLLLSKLCDVARNASDQIVLSALLGLTALACYSNYFYILSSVYGILKVITTSITASVGNSIASETVEKNYNDYRKFGFIFAWIRTWCTICLFCMYQPFMRLWGGDNLVLSNICMLLFCSYFYGLNMSNYCYLYFEAAGLWNYAKKAYIIQTVVNITLNVVLGKWIGIVGILIATNVVIFFCDYILQANILFERYFTPNYKLDAVKRQVLYIGVTLLSGIISIIFCVLLTNSIKNHVLVLAIRSAICIVIPNIICYLCYRRSRTFVEAKEFIKYRIIKR